MWCNKEVNREYNSMGTVASIGPAIDSCRSNRLDAQILDTKS